MNYIKDKHRASMSFQTLDNILRIRSTGPDDIAALPSYDFSQEFLKPHYLPEGISNSFYNENIYSIKILI